MQQTDGLIMVTKALDFAARKHVDQRRKGERAEPYLNHLTEVARLLAEATGGRDAAVVAAGLLHDTLEDTETTHAELVTQFGAEIAHTVAQVTDDKRLPKDERKRLQIEHAPHLTPAAKLVKLADKISNLRSLLAAPPKGWSDHRRREYLGWAHRVASGCFGMNPFLDKCFEDAYAACSRDFGVTERVE